ncbi:HD domain-containing protein [Candidatus Saccharibacteria bacterium]|nr:HD domain-containing protein [Candidatus Saccharibacteria bacterium]
MDNFESVLRFYNLANKLKTTIRTGWQIWDIKAPRLESVAEHIYGTQMLAIALCSELKLRVDLTRVVLMLAVHELGEIVVGDITMFDDISVEDKHAKELVAVQKVLSGLNMAQQIEDIYTEFEANKTTEARFCKQVDKLEACLQAKIYDEAGYADFTSVCKKDAVETSRLQFIKDGEISFSQAWLDNAIDTVGFRGGCWNLPNGLKKMKRVV